MAEERTVLCGANSYTEKYYLNPEFGALPEDVKKELRILTTGFTEEVGGILVLFFAPDGQLQLEITKDEGDYLYDDIEAELQIRRLQREKTDLFAQLELFYGTLVVKKRRAQEAAQELEDLLREEEAETLREEEEEDPVSYEDDEVEEEEEDPIESGEELYEDEMAEKLAAEWEEKEREEASWEQFLEELIRDL